MGHHPSELWTKDVASLAMPELTMLAKSMIVARRALHGPLPAAIIHDPSLDMLLHLFVAVAADEWLPLDELTSQTTVSSGVARRWTMALQDIGLVAVDNGAIRLTDTGMASMIETLQAVSRSQWQLG